MISASRYHDISCGHRVTGHENKCSNFHGHNYRITFECEGALDKVGRVLDFGVIKERLCLWLEREWDHKFLLWEEDDFANMREMLLGIVLVPFNPTAENMATYLLNVIGPRQLEGTGVVLARVMIEETRKCFAEAWLDTDQ